MLHGTSFIDRLIRGTFLFERSDVPWHTHAVDILSLNHYHKSTLWQVQHLSAKKSGEHVKESPIPIRITPQVVLEPYTQHRVSVTPSASGIHTVKPVVAGNSRVMLSAADCVIHTLPSQPLHIFLSNLSSKAMHLPKRIVLGYATSPSTAVTTSKSSLPQQSPMRTTVKADKSANGDANFAESGTDFIDGEEKDANNNLAAAVHYRPLTDKKSQVQRHVCVLQNETTKSKVNWRKEAAISAQYRAYWEPFANMVSELQFM